MSGRYKEINALLLFLLLPPANCVQSHRLKVSSILIVNLTRFSLFLHSAQRWEARQRLNLSTSQRDLSPSDKDHFEPLQPCLTSLTQRKINCTALVSKRSFPVGIRASISSQRAVVWSTVYPRVGSTPTPLRRPTRMALPHPSAPSQHSHLLAKSPPPSDIKILNSKFYTSKKFVFLHEHQD